MEDIIFRLEHNKRILQEYILNIIRNKIVINALERERQLEIIPLIAEEIKRVLERRGQENSSNKKLFMEYRYFDKIK